MKRRAVVRADKTGNRWSLLYDVLLDCGHVTTTSSTTGSAPKTARCPKCDAQKTDLLASQPVNGNR